MSAHTVSNNEFSPHLHSHYSHLAYKKTDEMVQMPGFTNTHLVDSFSSM